MKAKIVVLEERQHQGAPVMPNCTINDTSQSSQRESNAWTRNRGDIAVTGRFAHGQFARGKFAHDYCFFVKIY